MKIVYLPEKQVKTRWESYERAISFGLLMKGLDLWEGCFIIMKKLFLT